MAKIKKVSSSNNKFGQFFIRFGIGVFIALIFLFWIIDYINKDNLNSQYSLNANQEKRLENLRPDTIEYIPSLNEEILHNLGYTLGFNKGKNYTLSKIESKYPSLRFRVLKANNLYNRKFGASVNFIDSILFSSFQNQEEARNQFKERLESTLNNHGDYVNYEFSLAYLNNLENITGNFADSLALNTLLIFHPDYIENPELEFLDGFKERYQSKSHPKAKGLEFHIDLPESWRAKEANRPNIVQKFVSQNGKGFDMCMILINEMGYEITETETKELKSFTKSDHFEFLSEFGEGSYFIDGQYIELDNIKGWKIEYYVQKENELIDIWMRFKTYNLIYHDKLIQLQFSTGVESDELYKLNPKFNRSDKLFSLIANSFVLESKWID